MRNCIFENNELILCSAPVPMGYPQSLTHVCVKEFSGRLYMTLSPFPSIRTTRFRAYLRAILRRITGGLFGKLIIGETYENPCIYIDDKKSDRRVFRLMCFKPLMDTPDPYYGFPAYNSDPDLYIEDKVAYVLNRAIFRTKYNPSDNKYECIIRLYLIQGLLDDGRFKLLKIQLLKESSELSVSPCLIKYEGAYLLFQLYTNCYNDGVSFEGLRFLKCNTIEGLEFEYEWKTVSDEEGDYIPWHI